MNLRSSDRAALQKNHSQAHSRLNGFLTDSGASPETKSHMTGGKDSALMSAHASEGPEPLLTAKREPYSIQCVDSGPPIEEYARHHEY